MIRAIAFRRLTMLLAGVTVAVLAGCTAAPKGPSYPDIRFTQQPQIGLSASALDVSTTYRAPLTDPNVDHRFPVSLTDTARNWAQDRLKMSGGPNRVVYNIVDASAVEEKLDGTKGIKGAFTTDQSERYTARISVTLQIINDSGNVVGEVEVGVKRSHTVAENYTVNQRNQIWYDMTRDLARDLDERMSAEISKNLGPYLQ
ncbi:MAG: hypothetical protein RIC36_09295 [Rhodospirillales bacterium]